MSLSTDTNIIQVGLGDKVVSLFQACGMLITGFAIAFTKSWKMTLVVGTVIPYAIVSTLILGSFESRSEKNQKEVYSKAASIAEEALTSVVNITALCAKNKIVEKFKRVLVAASRYGIKKGTIEASIYGNLFFSMQSAYALALYYGVHLVSRGEIADGGTVITFVTPVS
jgi:ATP-binding cassette subfamily B (MDR/TAP) protein 1